MSDEYYEDKELICVDCKNPWIFTGGEQRFFAEKGLHAPKRCKDCRQKKREQNDGRGNRR
jgi:hypothetical protein